MIVAEFTEDNQIIVRLTLLDKVGQKLEIDTILDTGFSDYLMVPSTVVRELGLVEIDTVQAIMADGRGASLSVCEVRMEWDGDEQSIPVFVGGGKALLGMSMLRGCLGTFEFFPGGISTIEPAE